mgnify:CR=1 FL=1|jgi:hypothetical protein
MQHRALIVAVLLVLLLGAWYLTPAVLQGSCSQDTMEGRSRGAVDGHLCPDHGVLQEGRDHVVCVYPDRVVKVVRSCSSSSGVWRAALDHPRGPEHPSPNLRRPSPTSILTSITLRRPHLNLHPNKSSHLHQGGSRSSTTTCTTTTRSGTRGTRRQRTVTWRSYSCPSLTRGSSGRTETRGPCPGPD